MNTLKVLAVLDPAVKVYTDESYHILENFQDKSIEVRFDSVSWEKYFETMVQAFTGEADYDIVMIAGHLWLADFVSKDYLAPITYDFEDILPVIGKEMQYKGITYLSPSFCDGHMIVYRKSILQKVLGNLPKDVISTEEFIQIAHQLKEAGVSHVLALKAHASEIFLDALPYLRDGERDVYSQDEKGVACYIDKMTEGLEKYLSLRDLAPEDTYTYGNEEIAKHLSEGTVAMAVTWSGQLGVVLQNCKDQEDLGFATFETAWNVTWSFGISKASPNKEKAEGFLDYLRSKAVDQIAGAYSGAPIRRINYIEGAHKYPWYPIQLKMIENYAKPFESILGAGERNTILYEEIFNAFRDQKDPHTALLDAKKRMDAI